MLFGEWPLKGDHFNEGTGPKDTYGTLDPCSRSNITVARPEGHLGNTPVTEREREKGGWGALSWSSIEIETRQKCEKLKYE